MDNLVIKDAGLRGSGPDPGDCPLSPIPAGMRPIHRQYGLWICKSVRGVTAPATEPDALPFRHFAFYDLSHMYAGRGWLAVPGAPIRTVEPGEGILVTPGFKHKYKGLKLPYVEDAISFCGPVADHLFNAGVIRNGIIPIGKVRKLLPVIDLAQDNSTDGQIRANTELINLLVGLYLDSRTRSLPENPAFDLLLARIRDAPERAWSLTLMSEYCRISVSQLIRLFKRSTDMSPKVYVDSLRMRRASSLLATTSESVKAIAARCGYPDPYHFSRRFKEVLRYSPKRYRATFMRHAGEGSGPGG